MIATAIVRWLRGNPAVVWLALIALSLAGIRANNEDIISLQLVAIVP